jgi:hypothetical protein
MWISHRSDRAGIAGSRLPSSSAPPPSMYLSQVYLAVVLEYLAAILTSRFLAPPPSRSHSDLKCVFLLFLSPLLVLDRFEKKWKRDYQRFLI